mmetsp:Transcript_9776/g.28861  ORF Transcript_9776/g.28861 Transcript_9776/m.28861 type:complete len:278 (-) Transcript_9776:2-835(-)
MSPPPPMRSCAALRCDSCHAIQEFGLVSLHELLQDIEIHKAEVLPHGICGGEVLVLGVDGLGDGAGHLGTLRRAEADVRVLDDDALARLQVHLLCRELVHVRRWLLVCDHVSCKDANLARTSVPHLRNDGLHGLLVGRGAHGDGNPVGDCVIDGGEHAWAVGHVSVVDPCHEELRLAGMQLLAETPPRVLVRVRKLTGPAHLVPVRLHALFATAHLEELAVALHVPLRVKAPLRKRLVEARAVYVTLCLREHAIAVKEEGKVVVVAHSRYMPARGHA